MSIEAARKLVESLDLNIQEGEVGDPYFRDPNVHPFVLNEQGFRLIREVTSGRSVAFVDGGNQEIMGAPNFSIQLNRVYAGVWDKDEKVDIGLPRVEFFSATFSAFRNDEIYYDTILVPSIPEYEKYLPDAADLSFNSMDRSIMNGNQRADIERVASISRRFAEWRFANSVAGALMRDDVLVMDGTLQTTFVNEGRYLKELEGGAKKRGAILTGLSKTSTLFTTTGLSLLGAVNKLADAAKPELEWYYPIAESTSEDHDVMILAVKLNTASERVFRYEINRDQFNEMGELRLNQVLSELVKNSSDITLLGYPYGMIDADRFARVSFDELEYYRGLIASQVSGLGKWRKFSRYVHASDVHSILNMLVR